MLLELLHNGVPIKTVPANFWLELPNGDRVSPTYAGWTNDDGYELVEYVQPEEEPPLPEYISSRQIRLGLVSNGIFPSQVETIIAGMPDEIEREKALIEWEYATTFNRNHPLIMAVGSALGLTEEQIDTMWLAASKL